MSTSAVAWLVSDPVFVCRDEEGSYVCTASAVQVMAHLSAATQ